MLNSTCKNYLFLKAFCSHVLNLGYHRLGTCTASSLLFSCDINFTIWMRVREAICRFHMTGFHLLMGKIIICISAPLVLIFRACLCNPFLIYGTKCYDLIILTEISYMVCYLALGSVQNYKLYRSCDVQEFEWYYMFIYSHHVLCRKMIITMGFSSF